MLGTTFANISDLPAIGFSDKPKKMNNNSSRNDLRGAGIIWIN
jgi:hypothetical protein